MTLTKYLPGLVFALIIATAGLSNAQDQPATVVPDPGTISVTGKGSVRVVPDMASIRLGVVREAETARVALDANSKAMAEVLDALKAEGIADRDMQTSGLSIEPRYFYPKNLNNGTQEPPRIVGYQVSNMLEVRVRDISKAGNVLDKAVSLGVNSGGGISFGNQDVAAILNEARAKAVADAIDKAETFTKAAGVSLGRILVLSENQNGSRPVPVAFSRNADVAEAAVPIATGENRYEVIVDVQWEILQ